MENQRDVERIVITGMGAITPLGLTVAETWQKVVQGVSGIGPITLFDATHLPVQIAGEVKGFVPTAYMSFKEVRRRDRYEQLATGAVLEAIKQSGLNPSEEQSRRVGVVISSGIGGLGSLQEAVYTLKDQGMRKVSPFIIPLMMANGAAGMTSIDHGLRGPSFSVVSACASGIDALGMAWMMLRAGMLDAVVAGASEAMITEIGIIAFDRAGPISNRNDLLTTPQPFDLNRDGLAMGEGAAILVLERESYARERGAQILAELAGYSGSSDAHHITAPPEDGAGAAQAMRFALESAGVNADQVDYVSAHGTATRLNDVAETRAIKKVLGQRAYSVPVSSTKSMTGHLMSATGVLEAIFCIQSIREGIIPPTIHYQTPDPDCDLDYVPNQARELKVEVAIDNAFGFGGHNAVCVVRAYR